MLTAIKEDGSYITLPEKMTAIQLAELRMSTGYFCPCCKTEMTIKAGMIKIPHFAHKNNSSCHTSSEPESAYHLMGKRKLFQWLSLHQHQAVLEAYLPEIRKRADILVTVGEHRYAVEYQCSIISETEFIERTSAYRSVGIIPIWILAAKRLKRKKQHEFSLSAFQWLFVTGRSSHPFLWMYCPETNHLSALKNLTPFSPRNVFAELTSAPLLNLSPDKVTPSSSISFPFLTAWRNKRNSWSLHSVKTAKRNDPFFHNLYFHHLYPATIPIEIGVPVLGMLLIETPAIEWQAWLYMDVFQKKKPGERISLNVMVRIFMKRVSKGDIKLRCLPLLMQKDVEYPIKKYVQLIEKLGYILKLEEGIYQVVRQFDLPATSDEGQNLERMFYNERKLMIEKGYIHYNEV